MLISGSGDPKVKRISTIVLFLAVLSMSALADSGTAVRSVNSRVMLNQASLGSVIRFGVVDQYQVTALTFAPGTTIADHRRRQDPVRCVPTSVSESANLLVFGVGMLLGVGLLKRKLAL